MHAQPQCDIACLVVVSVAVAVFVVGDAAVAAVVAVVVVVCDLTAVPGRCDSCTIVLSRARTTMRWCRRMETPIGQVNKKKNNRSQTADTARALVDAYRESGGARPAWRRGHCREALALAWASSWRRRPFQSDASHAGLDGEWSWATCLSFILFFNNFFSSLYWIIKIASILSQVSFYSIFIFVFLYGSST